MPSPDVIVIGAGPAGLAVSAALRERGLHPVLLERADRVGASWDRHYDRLHLHTSRRLSSLPGSAIPRRYGRWVSRSDFATYLRQYADAHDLDVRTDAEVTAIERVDGDWTVRTTDGRRFQAPYVVLATGDNDQSAVPDWSGRESFTGELLHASDYRNPEAYAGRRVLVVGIGNSGAEIAADLAEAGVAVDLSVRTPPHIMRRDVMGVPAQVTSIAARRLPVRVVDAGARLLARVQTPDLTDYGLPRPDEGLYARVKNGAIPVLDVGIVDAIRSGRVTIVPAVERIFGDDVILHGGRRIQPDVIIAATGYGSSAGTIEGASDLVDTDGRPTVRGAAGHDGLFALGYTPTISGTLRDIRLIAPRIAGRIARDRRQHNSG